MHLLLLVRLFTCATIANGQVACSTPDVASICTGGTKCSSNKANQCLRCNNDLDCVSCKASYFLNNNFKCDVCPTGKTSPADSGSVLDCVAPASTSGSNFTNETQGIPIIPVPEDMALGLSSGGLFWVGLMGMLVSCIGCPCFGYIYNKKKQWEAEPVYTIGKLSRYYNNMLICGGMLICIGTLCLGLTSLIVVSTYTCPQGTITGGNMCIVCPMGTYENSGACKKCPTGRFQRYSGDFGDYNVDTDLNSITSDASVGDGSVADAQTLPCFQCTTPDCRNEICSEVTDGGENVPGCMCLTTSVEHSPSNDLVSADPFKSFTEVTGGEICTLSTGLTCTKGTCSASSCDGACCPINFDSREIIGCMRSKKAHCSEIASALFLKNPSTRVDVAVDCGEGTACAKLYNAKDAITLLYNLNLVDMIIEILAGVFWFMLLALQYYGVKSTDILVISKVVVMIFTVLPDFILQGWVLVLVTTNGPALLELEEARCLDTTTVNGQLYQKTLIGIGEDISSALILGIFEIIVAFLALILEIASFRDEDSAFVTALIGFLTSGMTVLGMLLAVLEFALIATPAYNDIVQLFSSPVTSGDWCMTPSNETMYCMGVSRIEDLGSGVVNNVNINEAVEFNHQNYIFLYLYLFFSEPILMLICCMGFKAIYSKRTE